MIALIKKIRSAVRHLLIGHLTYEHLDLEKKLDALQLAIGRHEARIVAEKTYSNLQDAEFKVYSQFGEDGIIQYLVHKVAIPHRIFVELGVGNYIESNTRFLLMNNNWTGKIVNCGKEHLEFLASERGKDVYYRHDIEAVSAFIEKETVNELIRSWNLPKDIGLLSIDLDGVDYWVWDAIDCISPRIVVMEYNSVFGAKSAVTVPYRKDFDRTKAHFSNLYFGASLAALCYLARKKGYQFVGSNSAGNNAFFVRKDLAKKLPNLSSEEGYVENKYRESKDHNGNLTYIASHSHRRSLIREMPLVDVKTRKTTRVKNI